MEETNNSKVLRQRLPERLTAAELRVMQWVIAGRSNVQIGLCLCRSEKTVRNQLMAVYMKLSVVNRAEAAAVFTQMKILEKNGSPSGIAT